jgi:hypothetical protein
MAVETPGTALTGRGRRIDGAAVRAYACRSRVRRAKPPECAAPLRGERGLAAARVGSGVRSGAGAAGRPARGRARARDRRRRRAAARDHLFPVPWRAGHRAAAAADAAACRPATALPAQAARRFRLRRPRQREDGARRPSADSSAARGGRRLLRVAVFRAVSFDALRRAVAGAAGRRDFGDRRRGTRHSPVRDLPCRCRGRHRPELSIPGRPIRLLHRKAEVAERLEEEEIRALALYFARVRPPSAALSSPIPAEPIPPPEPPALPD